MASCGYGCASSAGVDYDLVDCDDDQQMMMCVDNDHKYTSFCSRAVVHIHIGHPSGEGLEEEVDLDLDN